jgi:cyclic beta-1,2-glucan synthetase
MRIARPSLEDPIRAELFGIERLEQHAESLAAAQAVMKRPGRGRRLLQRVEHNGRVLRESYRVIANAIREERAITPAAEWLVDNFHVVDEQMREIRDDLPPASIELPCWSRDRSPAIRACTVSRGRSWRIPIAARSRIAPALRAGLPACSR